MSLFIRKVCVECKNLLGYIKPPGLICQHVYTYIYIFIRIYIYIYIYVYIYIYIYVYIYVCVYVFIYIYTDIVKINLIYYFMFNIQL